MRKFLFNLMAYHIGYDLIHPVYIIRHLRNIFSIPHDNHTIHNMLKFLQTVGNIDNADSIFF